MKLGRKHKHIMRLLDRDKKEDGWASVSEALYPVLSKAMPSDLVEFREVGGVGSARLTDEGCSVLRAMAWL
jgi:hypothetical protein